MTKNFQSLNDETRAAWNANAEVWDAKMGEEGNDFFRLLQWPVITKFLDASISLSATPLEGKHVLDLACGNGLTSRKLAALGAHVTASDFSSELIALAKARPNPDALITYHVVDATDESALLAFGQQQFDSALSNMALFDIADIEPLFRALPKLLKPGGCFVFSLMHPAFNNAACVHVGEEFDDGGIKTEYSVKISRYMTPSHQRGVALRNQPKLQLYFDRPLTYYINLGFQNGFVLDGFEERAFPPETPHTHPLAWGGNFSEIPPVVVMRMRLLKS